MDIATDREGNQIIVGYFNGTLDLGAGPMTGHELGDIFVVKLLPDRSTIWSKSFGDDDMQQAQRVAIDPDGNILITGRFAGTVDFGGGPLVSAGSRDVFVVKLDPAGNHIWSKRFGDSRDQFGRGVATDANGNIFIAGSVWGSVDFGGGRLSSAGFEDIFVAKLDNDGQHIWSKRFGDSQTQEVWDIATDGDGNVAMAAYVLGDVDFGDGLTHGGANPDAAIVKLSGDGQTLWSHRYGDQQQQFGQSVAVDSRGNIVLASLIQGSVDLGDGPVHSAGGSDFLVAKFNPAGRVLWHRRYGDLYDQFSLLVAVDSTDAVLLTGFSIGSVHFDECPIVEPGAFVTKLNSAGYSLWSQRIGDAADHDGAGVTSGLGGEVVVAGITANVSDLTEDAFAAHLPP
jgi:uncharacterized protein (AIM24 family)